MSLTPGARLGPYEILGPLGAGGMGEVYRARDTRLEREVAVKVLPERLARDPEALARFEREAKAVASLSHPNILAIHDFGVEGGTAYSVTELLEGEDLRAKLRGSPLPLRKAMDHALQIARGMAAAHDRGIIHRDLKPENVFITLDGRVKILDFGLAKLTRPEGAGAAQTNVPTPPMDTEPGAVMGTVAYMSPEQVRGLPADHRSDIFTLGTILYEVLTGRRPFDGNSAVETMNAILKVDPPDIAETNRAVPPALERIVRHCLEKSPEERFQSASDVAFDLETMSSLSTPGRGTPAVEARRREIRTRSAVSGLALLAALIVGFIAGRYAASPPMVSPPQFHRLTFRRGSVWSARFAPDGLTIVYSAAWDGGPIELFMKRPEGAESLPLAPGVGRILAISSSGELAVSLRCRYAHAGLTVGTLAIVPIAGGAPREILEDVQQADWSPDGSGLAVVRSVGGGNRLEYPIGMLLYETSGHISYPRFSPGGDRIAFFDHPFAVDDRGSVAVVDLAGNRTTLSTGWVSLEGLAWSPAGDEIWFSGAKTIPPRSLYALRLSGGERQVTNLAAGITVHDISRDGRVLLSRGDWRYEIAGRSAGEEQERQLSWLGFSIARDLSSDGKTLLFEEQSESMGPEYATCLRKMDGSPPVLLGEGYALALSPDGRWALSVRPSSPGRLVLWPTGPGESQTLNYETIGEYRSGTWFSDGKRILFSGLEPGHGMRWYVGDREGGKPRPVTPEGVSEFLPFPGRPLSPDGKLLAVVGPDRRVVLYPVDGGDPRPVAGVAEGDQPIGWSADGEWLYLGRLVDELPARAFRFSLTTGRKELIREFMPSDPAGVTSPFQILLTPDGRSYAYSYPRVLSDLYLVEGLK